MDMLTSVFLCGRAHKVASWRRWLVVEVLGSIPGVAILFQLLLIN